MIPLTYLILNIIHALWHSYLIKRNRKIQSKQKIIEYSIASILAGVILYSFLAKEILPLILFCLLTRMAAFDIALNLMRGKSWLYEGEIKKRKSFVDWLENKVGLSVWVYRLAYLVAYITYLIFYLWN